MIGLVSCAAKKLDHPAYARDLYVSPLFRMSLEYAMRHCRVTYILSALHGLLPLRRVVEPYDRKLRASDDNAAWGRRVVEELVARQGASGDLMILAGAMYVTPIAQALRDVGWSGNVVLPLAGKQIGERLAWLSRELSNPR